MGILKNFVFGNGANMRRTKLIYNLVKEETERFPFVSLSQFNQNWLLNSHPLNVNQ